MNYFIFDFKNHNYLIDSFLESASKAHSEEIKTKDWFYWKFRDNPFGESVLACVEEDGKIVGCVAYGFHDFINDHTLLNFGVSFENFVHPEYQRKGIFKKLIALSEKECLKQGMQFLLVFPNNNSLSGYLRMDWKCIEISEYWIKSQNIFSLIANFKKLKKGFKPLKSNLDNIKNEFKVEFNQNDDNYLFSEINSEYLKWRFFTFPNTEYAVVDNENCYSIARVGFRGNLKEIQVLFVNPISKHEFNLKELLKDFKLKTNYDVISFPISKHNNIKYFLKKYLFIKVPNSTNFCYKKLDKNSQIDLNKISLSAINFHTY